MNPNSAHQLWSKWTVTVVPGRIVLAQTRDQVVENTVRFVRKGFGSATQMRVTCARGAYRFEIRTEGVPAHDPDFQASMRAAFETFFQNGFGSETSTVVTVRIEAGDVQDGSPPQQLLILPSIILE